MFEDCWAAYLYGSRVYGTAQPNSDWDYILVKENAGQGEMISGQNNFKSMSPEHFQKLLDAHNISALECYFLPDKFVKVVPPKPWNFNLDLKKLRESVSSKANHSWVKAKKKFVSPYDWAEDERKRGKKSLFHSFRILEFGIQIAKHGQIIDYSKVNNIFEDIMTDPSNDWQDYHKRWKPIHNAISSEFRKIAPK